MVAPQSGQISQSGAMILPQFGQKVGGTVFWSVMMAPPGLASYYRSFDLFYPFCKQGKPKQETPQQPHPAADEKSCSQAELICNCRAQ